MDETTPPSDPSLLPPPEVGQEVVTYESEPPTNTAATMPQPTDAAVIVKQSPKKWWRLLVAVLLFVGIGGALAYNLWYQNPQKVITDSLIHAAAARTASYNATFSAVADNTAEITVDGMAANGLQSGNVTLSFTTAGKKNDIKGAAVIDMANNVYFKLTNVADLVKPYRAALPNSGQTLLDDLVTKLGSNWIKLSPTDLKNYNSSFATTEECTTAALKTLQGNASAGREIGAVYKKHQFITIDKKLGSKNGSLGYQISANQSTLRAFEHDVEATAVYKALHQCNPNVSPSSLASFFGGTSQQATIYVSRFTHQLTSLSATGKDSKAKTSATFTITPMFNVPVTIQVPKKTTTIAQLLSDLQAVLQSASKP
jgi:hypothetical protein